MDFAFFRHADLIFRFVRGEALIGGFKLTPLPGNKTRIDYMTHVDPKAHFGIIKHSKWFINNAGHAADICDQQGRHRQPNECRSPYQDDERHQGRFQVQVRASIELYVLRVTIVHQACHKG